MYKLRMKYQKTGDLRFLSHLDLARALERGLRRARLPLSLSEGFSPHPRLSFGPPLPVGVSSESEYIDLVLDKRVPLVKIAQYLNHSFPADLSCRQVRYVPLDSPSLMKQIQLASYRIIVSVHPIVSSHEIERCFDLFLSQRDATFVVRDKERVFPVSQIVRSLALERVEEGTLEISFLGLVSSSGGVRPDFVIREVLAAAPMCLDVGFREIHRKGLYGEKNGDLLPP